MKKKIAALAATGALLLSVAAVLAAPGGKDNPANDNPQNLYLYEKDAGWEIVWDGAWGKYNYKLSGENLSGVFNGHGLVPGTDYTLVEYDSWPNVTVIGSDMADAAGNVHIAGTAGVGPGGEILGKYKIWLVRSSEITAEALNTWPLNGALFEHNLIP